MRYEDREDSELQERESLHMMWSEDEFDYMIVEDDYGMKIIRVGGK